MQTITIETYEFPFGKKIVLAAALDSPRHNGLQTKLETTFAGWILPTEEESPPIHLLLVTENGEHLISPEIERPDVVSRVLKKDADNRLKCGFSLSITKPTEAKLYILSDEKRHLWKQFTFTNVNEELISDHFDSLIQILMLPRHYVERNNQHEANKISNLSTEHIRGILASKIKIGNFQSLKKLTEISACVNIDQFNEYLKNPQTISDWIRSAITSGYIEIPQDFGLGDARCSFSYTADSNITLLFFESPTEPFIVFQHVTYADMIFFPKHGFAAIFQHITEPTIAACLAEAAQWVINNCTAISKKQYVFGGATSGFKRPYHFFYDIAPALRLLDDEKLLSAIPNLYCTSGSFFADPRDFLEQAPKFTICEPVEIRQKTITNEEFHCHLGLNFPQLPQDLNDRVDTLMRDAALRKFPQPPIRDRPESNPKNVRIWWGITGQKRSWIEQVEGTAYILDQLSVDYPDLEVVFDGWTSPVDPGQVDAREIQNDEAVVASIMDRMKKKPKTVSVIGKSSLEKIAIATTCDAFVANYSTGSMHVSRIARRPGVLHINNSLRKEEHIQHRAVVVPASRTRDLPEDDDKRADFVSYSIDPDDILFLLRSVIEARNSN